MNTNATSNNVWICKFCKKTLSKRCNYQSHMDICKVYKDHLKTNCVDQFKQQLKHGILNEVKLCLDALKDDVFNAKTNNNIKQSYNFKLS